MVGMVCLRLAPEKDFIYFNATSNQTEMHEDLMNEVRLGISGTLACLTAIIQVLITLRALSFKATFKRNVRKI